MIDINKLREKITTKGLDVVADTDILEVLDRLEAAENDVALKEQVIDALGSELNAVANERDTLRAEVQTWQEQAKAYWSKIEQMERQEHVGTLHDDGYFVWRKTAPREASYGGWKMKLYALPGAQPALNVPDHKTIRDLLNESGLCAYDREGDLAFMVAATKFAALAAAPKPEAKP